MTKQTKQSAPQQVKHTPGPWKIREDTIIGPSGNVIAEVGIVKVASDKGLAS